MMSTLIRIFAERASVGGGITCSGVGKIPVWLAVAVGSTVAVRVGVAVAVAGVAVPVCTGVGVAAIEVKKVSI
jgi:hypothetical protein